VAIITEKVIETKHWSDKTFTFKTTRKPGMRFKNGEFVMMGLKHEGKNILRAYSVASANHEEYLEWLSIKVQDGELTSKLQNLKVGDEVIMNDKATGTLVIDYLKPGRNLYLVSTGTGLAPFLSIINDPETYENFDKVILTHTVQHPDELVYREELEFFNTEKEFFTQGKFLYFNTLTQSEWPRKGRITKWLREGTLWPEVGTMPYDAKQDRMMICGSMGLNEDVTEWLESIGAVEGNTTTQGEYVVEKAFVTK
jgi:ferredoxin--NADP+ reductase|tara:strand:- start:162 stop:923 length:762 start_codon:yes stop_codon:yes gene_type:complete